MTALKFILLSSCLLLSACQSTSLRELTASEANTAKKEQNKTSQSTGKHYPELQKNQQRMYVFTSYQDPDEKNTERNGYFIDFKASVAPSKITTKE